MLYDISLPLSNRVAQWPGDAAYRKQPTLAQTDRDSVNVAQITLSLHFATHADAPFHVNGSDLTIDRVPLDPFWGPCVLVDASELCQAAQAKGYDAVIPTSLLEDVDFSTTPRLLLRTGTWHTHEIFPESIPVVAPDMPQFLADRGVVLFGLDVPSVDPLDCRKLPIHHALRKFGIQILESLDLREPPAGNYELVALPLKIADGDASPVRAALRRLAR